MSLLCRKLLFLLLLPVAVGSGLIADARAEQARNVRILVLTSHGTAPYEKLLEGFKSRLLNLRKEAELYVYSTEDGQFKADLVSEKARGNRADLILAIGSHALNAAMQHSGGLPIVAGLIPSAGEIKAKANVTGVVMEFPFDIQFQKMRQILPQCRNIGIIYSPANALTVESAGKAASAAGLILHGRQITTPSEIPDALEYLANRIEVLLGLPDDLVFTANTAKHILLYSFRNRIPLVGLSSAWVKAGALYALEWDYVDLGFQCAEMAAGIVNGSLPTSLPPARPRKVLYSLNLRTAAHMKVEIPESIGQGAAQVYKEK